jgi:hypothetical protein
MRLLLFFCCFAGIIHPSVGHSEQYADLVQEMACGSINWSKGTLTATGLTEFEDEADMAPSQPELAQRAYHFASCNMLDMLTRIRVDDHHRVSDLIKADPSLLAILDKMNRFATVLDQMHLPDGRVQVTLQAQISGAFAQLILPVAIKQVETIKPMNIAASGPGGKSNDYSSQTPEVYTGLIVDARGIGVQPAMVPLILDENGKELYGPAFISREYAVQYRTCEYVRNLEDGTANLARVGQRPIIIKGLRAKSKDSCDILVSTADAARLRSVSAHLNFLKECRVIIVLD